MWGFVAFLLMQELTGYGLSLVARGRHLQGKAQTSGLKDRNQKKEVVVTRVGASKAGRRKENFQTMQPPSSHPHPQGGARIDKHRQTDTHTLPHKHKMNVAFCYLGLDYQV